MNRRSFLTGMLKAGVASMILPSAATYARRWVKHDRLYLMGDWVEMEPLPWPPGMLEFWKAEADFRSRFGLYDYIMNLNPENETSRIS